MIVMKPVGMMLSTKPRKNRCANKPSWVVTVAVNIQISDQRSTTAPKIRPKLKRWRAKVRGYRPASIPK